MQNFGSENLKIAEVSDTSSQHHIAEAANSNLVTENDVKQFAAQISKEFFEIAEQGEKAIIEKILHADAYLKKLVADGLVEECEHETVHRFSPGVYLREVHLKKDSLVVGKIHKHEHLNFISKGSVTVLTKDGAEHYVAPVTMTSTPGTQRLLYTHEDTIWSVIHPNQNNTQDLEEIESREIAKSYDEFLLLSNKESEG